MPQNSNWTGTAAASYGRHSRYPGALFYTGASFYPGAGVEVIYLSAAVATPGSNENQKDELLLSNLVITQPNWIQAPNQEPALELHSRAAPSLKAHHHVNGPDTGRNSGGCG